MGWGAAKKRIEKYRDKSYGFFCLPKINVKTNLHAARALLQRKHRRDRNLRGGNIYEYCLSGRGGPFFPDPKKKKKKIFSGGI